MTIHYHGLPITPERMLLDLGGKHVCISFATKRDSQVKLALRIMQSVMFDCGAYTVHRQDIKLDIDGYYDWLSSMLYHPHWAVIPDKIGGNVGAQRDLLKTWPFAKALGAPVWHLSQPLDYLIELAQAWPRVCLGSSKEYWKIGTKRWNARMDEVFRALADAKCEAAIHGLRMMNEAASWPLASVDSTNVAQSYKRNNQMPSAMADRLDRSNAPRWR